MTWTLAMYERLLRLDGQVLDDVDEGRRADAIAVLSEVFPVVSVAEAVLDRLEHSPRPWTSAGEQRLRELYADTPTADLARLFGRPLHQVYNKARRMGLAKSAAFMVAQRERLGRGLKVTGRAYRFPKGHVPWTLGRRGYDAGGRSHETRFRKGQMAGAAQRKWVPVGTEVRDSDGYLKRKVADDRTVPSRFNWKFVHLLLWQEHNGPVPPGHAVVFRNRDRADIRIDNLELVSRAELIARNTIHRYPPELKHAIRLNRRLQRTIAKAEERPS